MARRELTRGDLRTFMTDVMHVQVIKDVPEGMGGGERTVRVGEVVALPREQARLLIGTGHAIRYAEEGRRVKAADACSAVVSTTVPRPPVAVDEIVGPRPHRTRRAVGRPSMPHEWELVIETRLNTVLIGPRPVTDRLVRSLPQLARSVIRVLPHLALALPPADQVATLVLMDVFRLDVTGQRDVREWLEHASARTRTISTSPIPLLPMVAAGSFDAALYYRLNMLYVRC